MALSDEKLVIITVELQGVSLFHDLMLHNKAALGIYKIDFYESQKAVVLCTRETLFNLFSPLIHKYKHSVIQVERKFAYQHIKFDIGVAELVSVDSPVPASLLTATSAELQPNTCVTIVSKNFFSRSGEQAAWIEVTKAGPDFWLGLMSRNPPAEFSWGIKYWKNGDAHIACDMKSLSYLFLDLASTFQHYTINIVDAATAYKRLEADRSEPSTFAPKGYAGPVKCCICFEDSSQSKARKSYWITKNCSHVACEECWLSCLQHYDCLICPCCNKELLDSTQTISLESFAILHS